MIKKILKSKAVYLFTSDKLGCETIGNTFTDLALFSLLSCRGNDKLLHFPYSTESLASFSTQSSQYEKLKLNSNRVLRVFAGLVTSASHNHLLKLKDRVHRLQCLCYKKMRCRGVIKLVIFLFLCQ